MFAVCGTKTAEQYINSTVTAGKKTFPKTHSVVIRFILKIPVVGGIGSIISSMVLIKKSDKEQKVFDKALLFLNIIVFITAMIFDIR